MATINFLLRSKKENTPIYLRLSLGRGKDIFRKTGLFISPVDWSSKTRFPKQTTAENKNINTQLKKLEVFVIEKLNEANVNSNEINGEWLFNQIGLFFNRISDIKDSDLILDGIDRIIKEAPTRKNSKGGIGLSNKRVSSYKALKRVIKEYNIYERKQHKIKDVDLKFSKKFLNYLLEQKEYMESTSLKLLADLKTVCNDAEIYGIEINPQYRKIQSSKLNNENILFLSTKELEQINMTNLISEAHKNARKWLLLGCSIGQRVSDLLKLNESNFIVRNDLKVIELKQQKTNKNVTIPVLEDTKKILKTGLPYPISAQKFNKHIKDICRLSGIDEIIKGSKVVIKDNNGVKEKRKAIGSYPKWQLMSSHVCRRSFASNLYGMLPTPLIMRITSHSSEKMLLNYIGKDSLDYAQQIADFYTLQAIKEKKEPQLNVIKNIS